MNSPTWEASQMPCLRCERSVGMRSLLRLCRSCQVFYFRHGGTPTTDLNYLFTHLRRTTETGCWEWLGAINPGGYGRLRNGYVHRFSFEHFKGAIPDGFQVDHLCRNRRCFNPDHLEAVPQAENIRRGASPAAIAARATHCAKGHKWTPENTYIVPGRGNARRCRMCTRLFWARKRKAVAA